MSCNVTFMSLADELGNDAMTEQAEKFGFNSTSLEDLAGQAESLYPRDMDPPQTAMSGIGQASVTATPLQMAMVVAGIANDGDVMRPYVVDEVRAPNLSVLEPRPAEHPQGRLQHDAEELTEMMVATVDDGTATPAPDPRRAGGRQDRHRAVHRRPTAVRLVPSRSPRPTTPRSPSRSSSSPATPRPTRSAAAPSAGRSPSRSWRR